MNILFICASLEPGRDGVGDYTLRLAGECARRGQVCTVLALHDPYVRLASDRTPDHVRLIRLPAGAPWSERLTAAIGVLREIAPDWVSWQLVAYGFHPRGFLPGALLQRAGALRGPRCHVMVHELWLGLETGAGWRARALGWLQRRGVLCLLDQLDPDCVHTSNSAYQRSLIREGYAAEILGLFGNVPITDASPDDDSALARWLPATPDRAGAAPLVALTFGTLHPQWQPVTTVDWLLATARRLGRAPALIALGRAGVHAAGILHEFRQQGVLVGLTGEVDGPTVSRLMRAADLGLAPHPWALIGKSGAAAVMLEHGLPVLVPRDDWQLRGDAAPTGVAADPLLTRLAGLDAAGTDRWLAARRAPQSSLPGIAEEFLQALAAAAPVAAGLPS